MSAWARKVPGGWLLSVFAQPASRRSQIAGLHGAALKVRIGAPPAEGRANDELLKFLSMELGIPKRCVTLLKGAGSRRKTLLVEAPHIDPTVLLKVPC